MATDIKNYFPARTFLVPFCGVKSSKPNQYWKDFWPTIVEEKVCMSMFHPLIYYAKKRNHHKTNWLEFLFFLDKSFRLALHFYLERKIWTSSTEDLFPPCQILPSETDILLSCSNASWCLYQAWSSSFFKVTQSWILGIFERLPSCLAH